MKLVYALFFMLFTAFSGVCQDSDERNDRHPPPLPLEPAFHGGKDSLAAFIKKHTAYPSAARRHHITGIIEVDFIVGKDGAIKDPKVLKPLGYGCDEEAIKVVKEMPKWEPAELGRDPIELEYHVLIPFGKAPEPK